MADVQIPDLSVAAKVIEHLQRHPSRDEVELVVDLGLDSEVVHSSIDALMKDGFVVEREVDGHRVYEVARVAQGRSLAELLASG